MRKIICAAGILRAVVLIIELVQLIAEGLFFGENNKLTAVRIFADRCVVSTLIGDILRDDIHSEPLRRKCRAAYIE